MYLCSRPASKTNSIRSYLVAFLAFLVLFSSGCTPGRATPAPPKGTFPVDPVFQDFYKAHGGRNILGPAISPMFPGDNKLYQYTVASLLRYDRAAPEGERVSFSPLGRNMGIYEQPNGEAPKPGERYQNGYQIFDKFVPLFDKLGGEAVTGKPLTGVYKNTTRDRYEQFFENLGFFWLEGDRDNAVHLLAYGAWNCGIHCPNQPPGPGIIELPHSNVLSFVRKAAELGLDFTGEALSAPFNQAGQRRQIYENIVFTADQQNQSDVKLFALPEAVGRNREEPRPPSPAPDMEFYDVGENQGYNVPKSFTKYILDHGGFDFVGEPINHVYRPDDQTMQQCFVSLCLEGKIDEKGEIAVSVMPLGLEYNNPENPTPAPHLDDLTIEVGETHPMISPDQEQEIWAVVFSADVPVPNIEPELTMTMPDETEQIYRMAATDENGETRQIIPPIEAKNGTLVRYNICVQLENQQRFCAGNNYVIWPVQTIQITPTLPPTTNTYLPFLFKNVTLYVPAFLDRFITYLPFLSKEH